MEALPLVCGEGMVAVKEVPSVATVPIVAGVPPMERERPVRRPEPLKVTVAPGAPEALLSAGLGATPTSTAPMSQLAPWGRGAPRWSAVMVQLAGGIAFTAAGLRRGAILCVD